jgi:hypothetical protein
MDLLDVEKALENVRIGLKRDGADLVVNSSNDEGIELSLIIENSACLECIVSNEILIAKVQRSLSKVVSTVPRVVIHDPRNS